MFIQTNYLNTEGSTLLSFLKSLAVSAYPCGRRRGQPDPDKSDNFIPFDPEARLNTEANARKYSSLNGYSQSYILDWSEENKKAIIVLGGYYFEISSDDLANANTFGTKLIDAQKSFFGTETSSLQYYQIEHANKIYANIRIEQAPLFVDTTRQLSYTTGILKNQTGSTKGSTAAIDVIVDGADTSQAIYNDANYYFSGLSFSISPITNPTDDGGTYSQKEILNSASSLTHIKYNSSGNITEQQVLSLQILEKSDGKWQVFRPALLPKLEHGTAEDSVKMSNIYADSINLDGISVPSLSVVPMYNGLEVADPLKYPDATRNEKFRYRLKFKF